MPNKQFSKEVAVARFRKRHGERFNYDKVEFVDNDTEITVTCGVHGDFQVTPNRHYLGPCCKGCKNDHLRNIRRKVTMTREEYIVLAVAAHGDKYDYSKMEYLGTNHPIVAKCKKHGNFQVMSRNHLDGSGCNACRLDADPHFKETAQSRHDRLRGDCVAKHGKIYDYRKTKFHHPKNEIKFQCLVHGSQTQFLDDHLENGCPDCPTEKPTTLEAFLSNCPRKLCVK